MKTPSKLTRRQAISTGLVAGVAGAASVVRQSSEPEPDIRPVLPFTEEQARALSRPSVSTPRGEQS